MPVRNVVENMGLIAHLWWALMGPFQDIHKSYVHRKLSMYHGFSNKLNKVN